MPAVYLLGGILSLTAALDKRYFSLFGAITRLDPENPLHQVAMHQLAIKKQGPSSWFGRIAELGSSYGIDVHQAITNPWPKEVWKAYINKW